MNKMETLFGASSPTEVKKEVTFDLKTRHLTQQEAGEMIGVVRQTISNILSNGKYFTKKQAALFSLAFGYDKEYLMTGKGKLNKEYLMTEKGRLPSPSSSDELSEALEYKNRQLNIFRKVQEIYAIGLDLVIKHGVEECKLLIEKLDSLHNLIKTIEQIPYEHECANLRLMSAAELMFVPFYNDVVAIIKRYGVEINSHSKS